MAKKKTELPATLYVTLDGEGYPEAHTGVEQISEDDTGAVVGVYLLHETKRMSVVKALK